MSRVEEIKRQAIILMAEKGFEAMSLRQLAAAVGLQPGSIYTHYQSKGQLLLDLCRDYLEDLMSAWQEQRPRHRQGIQKKLMRFVAVYFGFCHVRAEESRIVQLDFRSLDEQGKAVVGALKEQYEAELAAILRQGVLAGVFRSGDLQALQMAILSVMQGFCGAGSAADYGGEARTLDNCAEIILHLVSADRLAQFNPVAHSKPPAGSVAHGSQSLVRRATAVQGVVSSAI